MLCDALPIMMINNVNADTADVCLTLEDFGKEQYSEPCARQMFQRLVDQPSSAFTINRRRLLVRKSKYKVPYK